MAEIRDANLKMLIYFSMRIWSVCGALGVY